jgi:hypothetical protein
VDDGVGAFGDGLRAAVLVEVGAGEAGVGRVYQDAVQRSFFIPTGSAQALGADCDDVRDGNYIQYSWADSDSSFTFKCEDGKWVFVG